MTLSRLSHCSLFVLLCAGTLAARGQVSLLSVVDEARRNAPSVKIAQADVAKAEAVVSQTRDAYVPSLEAGSSAGYSYGFLGGVPSVFDAQIRSLLISFSQPDYIRAAKAGLHTATLNLQDAVDQVELDTALDYIQLNSFTQQLAALQEEKSFAEKLDAIEQNRLTAGLESEIAVTRVQLTDAQADLKRIDLQAQAGLLRKRLSNLTGLPESAIETESETIPGPPSDQKRLTASRTAAVDAGFSDALSKHYEAHGDARQNYRPQVGFGFSYQYLVTTLNNYNSYYNTPLRPNNFGAAAQITFPLFNAGVAAKARQTAAEALRADRQAELGRKSAEEQALQVEGNLPILRAQARMADLQAKLAAQQLDGVLVQLKGPPTGPMPLTPADEMEARISERARFTEALDAHFNLLKAQLSLLRLNGGLSEWINQGAR